MITFEPKKLTGEELLERFETDRTPEDSFHHVDHVRLAFEYLQRFATLQALGKFSDALRRFATRRGKPNLYNETITCAYFFLIRARIATGNSRTWEDFASRNADLLVWKGGILTHYYAEDTLGTDLARKVFILPDKGLCR